MDIDFSVVVQMYICLRYVTANKKESNFDLLGGGDIFLEPNWAFLRGLDDEVAFFFELLYNNLPVPREESEDRCDAAACCCD